MGIQFIGLIAGLVLLAVVSAIKGSDKDPNSPNNKIIILKHNSFTHEYEQVDLRPDEYDLNRILIERLNKVKAERNLKPSEWRFKIPDCYGLKGVMQKKIFDATGFETVRDCHDFYLDRRNV